MENWIPTIIEALVFLGTIVGVLVRTSNKIKENEARIENLEHRTNRLEVNVGSVQASLSKIETALARIETEILWIKEIKKGEINGK